jgi:DNA uptake protein ComE-like DNA-binding protein
MSARWVQGLVAAAALIAVGYALGARWGHSEPAVSPSPATQPAVSVSPLPSGLTTGRVQTLRVIDLNSASLAELQTLPGVTPDYARKIIAGRPFESMNDVERAGIPHQLLEQITPPAMLRVLGPRGR